MVMRYLYLLAGSDLLILTPDIHLDENALFH